MSEQVQDGSGAGERIRVVDVPERDRFEIHVSDRVAGFADYQRRSDRIVLTHTEIDSNYQGMGLAGRLAARALDTVREQGLYVTPVCAYVADYIQKHPEYADLVDERHRGEVSPD